MSRAEDHESIEEEPCTIPGEDSHGHGLTGGERKARRQEIVKKGAIPEFVRVREVFDLYRYFTEANMKNKLLVKSAKFTQECQDSDQSFPHSQTPLTDE